jgi:hypothetical protein
MVDAANNELDLTESVLAAFTLLTDCPASYTGAGGKLVKVNAGATGLEFVADGSSSYADGKVSDTAYDATTWDGVTGIAPSKNAVRDKIESLKDEKVKYDANDVSAGYLSTKIIAGTNIALSEGTGGDVDKLKISVNDTGVKVAIDFVSTDELTFTYKCPVPMVFTSQEYELSAATIVPALNTNLAQYATVSVTVTQVELIVLNGNTL